MLSVFVGRQVEILNRILIMLFISSLVCLFIVNNQPSKFILPGQEKKYIIKIETRVLEDSREISGGKYVFPVEILYAYNTNLTSTSASGRLEIISTLKLFKGQNLYITKRNILQDNSSVIYADKRNIEICSWGNSFYDKILKKRASILFFLKLRIKRMRQGPSVLFFALFTGVKENPKGELFTLLRKAGASHLLALSGMHLGIISVGVMFLLQSVLSRHISIIFTLLLIFIYVFLVDAGPSLTRAAIFFTLLGFSSIRGLKVDIFHVLVICFLIQVIINPGNVYTLSFKLSYLALGGIVLFGDKITGLLPGYIPYNLRVVLAASVSAQLFTAPVVLQQFGVIYPVGIISGLILVPLITVFMWLGLIALMPLPWILRNFIFLIIEKNYKLVEFFADVFSKFPVLNIKSADYLGIILIFIVSISIIRKFKIIP